MNETPTPRSDEMLKAVIIHDEGDTYDVRKMVPVTFARQLESELITVTKELNDRLIERTQAYESRRIATRAEIKAMKGEN